MVDLHRGGALAEGLQGVPPWDETSGEGSPARIASRTAVDLMRGDRSLQEAESDTMPEAATMPVLASQSVFRGYFDGFENAHARGWVMDVAAPEEPVELTVLIDGEEVERIVADATREDVRHILQHPDGRVGFSYDVRDSYLDGVTHRISFRLPDGTLMAHIGQGGVTDLLEAHEFSGYPTVTIEGNVDNYSRGALRGWVLRRIGRDDKGRGGCHLTVTCNGVRIGQVKADRFRIDVATAMGCDANCGFEFAIPVQHRKSYPQTFCFFVIPDQVEIGGSPFTTSVIDDHLEGRLLDITARMNNLHRDFLRDLTSLRRDMALLLPETSYNIDDYDRWARRYYDHLRARTATARRREREAGGITEPLVTVMVPVYKPVISDFVACVESVIAQTWQNWELILVDDGGKSPEVSRRMDAFAAADKRIRCIRRQRNVGIAKATNVALEAARGEWIVFFDHDDVLVDVALEVMLREQRRTGAKMLYSDEDKVDAAGYFQEPNFKPDWNYRYMLGCNYVCHLLIVDTKVIRKVGLLRSDYDGAQDHDYILRISEQIPHSAIHHVREMLYHWRKTPNSTASDISNKGYAVQAGVRAVTDHLKRMGRAADVEAINNLTIYSVAFLPEGQPKVTVVIPFKDEIETTRNCIETLLETTDYTNFDIVLVDNWSTTLEAQDFRAEIADMPRVRILPVEEEFNYSRLNNLAVANSSSDLVLFMNNDVFVTEPGWLGRMIGEFTDGQVGAVGAKLVYPVGSVQHAGVVVGIHGAAAHVHAGIGAEDYGYIGRARLSQEFTACTAALLLVRRSVFDEVGGFDERQLRVAYNDVDFCLKIRDAGYKIIWNAETVAEHHESLSRGSDMRPEQEQRFFVEQQAMFDRWASHKLFLNDPAYNPWFTREDRPFYDLRDPASDPTAMLEDQPTS